MKDVSSNYNCCPECNIPFPKDSDMGCDHENVGNAVFGELHIKSVDYQCGKCFKIFRVMKDKVI